MLLNAASFVLIGYCCELAGTFQYLEIGRRALGKRFGLLSQLIVNAYAVGSLISFVVLTGDFLIGAETGILSVWANNTIFYQQVEDPDGTVRCSWSSRCFVLYLIAVAIFLPLSLLRKIERLKATSAISLISTIYAGILTVTVYVTQNPNALLPQERAHHVQPEWFDINVHLWSAIPIMNVAFTAHYNAPRFYEELADRSIRRFVFVVALALGFSLAVYASVGVCGYLTFGSLTLGDVLRNFSSTYELAVLARLALAFTVIMTFPFAHHSVRRGVIALYFGDGKNTDNIEFGSLLKITLIIVFASTTIGVLATKVEVVLAYKGAIFGSLMVYILPPSPLPRQAAAASDSQRQCQHGRLRNWQWWWGARDASTSRGWCDVLAEKSALIWRGSLLSCWLQQGSAALPAASTLHMGSVQRRHISRYHYLDAAESFMGESKK